jgi:hypothetical protein
MRTTPNALWAILALWSLLACANAATFTVINTLEEGEGSMWWAVEQTNESTGPDTVLFAIPLDDPGYDPEIGVWTIRRTHWWPYPLDDHGTYVDGFSQARFIGGDPNPLGPEIELEIYSDSPSGDIMAICGDGTQIRGLCINGSGFAEIGIFALPPGRWIENVVVAGCYLGVDPTGTSAESPSDNGVRLYRASGTRIGGHGPEERNIIVAGWNVEMDSCSNIAVINNYLGTDRTGTVSLVGGIGLDIDERIGPVLVQDNLIAADGGSNIEIGQCDSDDAIVTILNNRIGVGLDGSPMGGFHAIDIHQSPGHLIKENVVAHITGHYGIDLSGDATDYVTITRNSIYECRGGIDLSNDNENFHGVDFVDGVYGPGVNEEIDTPLCESISAHGDSTTVYFRCMPDCIVEVFIADPSVRGVCSESGYDYVYSGMTYLGDAEETVCGPVWSTYSFTVSPALPSGTLITCTATNQNGSTSEFGCSCTVPLAGETAEGCVPEGYRLLPPSPNPATDVVQVRYLVPISGSVDIKAYDLEGSLVAEIANEVVKPGEHAVLWELTNSDDEPLSSGVYLLRLTAEDFVATREVVVAR